MTPEEFERYFSRVKPGMPESRSGTNDWLVAGVVLGVVLLGLAGLIALIK